jgi:hypothetical protein
LGDRSQTAIWSYHIWVTDYDPDTGPTYTNTYNTNNNGSHFVFMDRSLGATRASLEHGWGTGLFYQWGRKDPFPATLNPGGTQPGGGSFTAAETSATRGTVVNAILHPDVFYYGVSSTSYDWHYAFRENTLWGHNAAKTVYDPCPVGWRVPVNSGMSVETSPWYGFTHANGGPWNGGYNWGTNALYADAGYRERRNGLLSGSGGDGSYWEASPYSIDDDITSYGAGHLHFYGTSNFSFAVHGIDHRAYGFNVRCVKE